MSSTSVSGLQHDAVEAGCGVGGRLWQHADGWGMVAGTDLQQPDGGDGGGGGGIRAGLLQLQFDTGGGGVTTTGWLQQLVVCGIDTGTFDLQQLVGCGGRGRGGGGVVGLSLFAQYPVSSISGGLLIEQHPDGWRLIARLQHSDDGGGVGDRWGVCFELLLLLVLLLLPLLQQGLGDFSWGVEIGDGLTGEDCNDGDIIGLVLDSWELVDVGWHGLSGPHPPWHPSNGSHWQFSQRQMPASAVIS